MSFAAKSVLPIASDVLLRQDNIQGAAAEQIAVFNVPPGCLLTDGLAASLVEHGRPIVWLGLGGEDADAATVLLSLIAASRRITPGIAGPTMETIRTHRGPVAGWPRLFGKGFEQQVQDDTAIVLENTRCLNATNPVLRTLATHFLPALPSHTACFLISERPLLLGALPPRLAYAGFARMRVDARSALRISTRAGPELPSARAERLVSVSEGRAGALADSPASVRMLGSNRVRRILQRAKNAFDYSSIPSGPWLSKRRI